MAVDFSHVKSITIPEGNVKKIEAGGNVLWQAEEPEETPLCFTAELEKSKVGYSATSVLGSINIQKSTDGVNWEDWDGSVITLTNIGDKLFVRNTENQLSFSDTDTFIFGMSGKIAASGNVNSLINYSALSDFCFSQLFYSCQALTKPPILPATTLEQGCYYQMFRGCNSLTIAPILPATSLIPNCYQHMFYGCTSLRVRTSSGTKIFTCPSRIPSASVDNMFYNTGGEFTGTPVAGETYYYY